MRLPPTATADEIRRAFEQIGEIVFGRMISGRPVGTSETAIAHGLKRVPKGWVEMSRGADPARESTGADDTNLYLVADAAITPKLWVW